MILGGLGHQLSRSGKGPCNCCFFQSFSTHCPLDLGTFGRFCPLPAPSLPLFTGSISHSDTTPSPCISCCLYSTKSHLAMSIQNYSSLFLFCSGLSVYTQKTSAYSVADSAYLGSLYQAVLTTMLYEF